MHFEFTRDLADLNDAVHIQEQAIALAEARPDRLGYLQNLSNMLTERIQAAPNEADNQRLQRVEAEIHQLQGE